MKKETTARRNAKYYLAVNKRTPNGGIFYNKKFIKISRITGRVLKGDGWSMRKGTKVINPKFLSFKY